MKRKFSLAIFCLLIFTTFCWAEWQIETVDSADTVGDDNSIAVDSSGNSHISYYDTTNGNLKYAKWNGVSWSTQTVDSAGDVGYWTSIAIDGSDNPHISYCDWTTNGDLKYAKLTGSSWSIQTVDSAGVVGKNTSIAVDTNNNPHISYYDTTNAGLKYARWDGISWSTTTIENYAINGSSVGEYTSIALDSNNYPHISYRDDTNGDLKYAKWTGSAWSTSTVDSNAYTSDIAIDTNGYPHIFYYDSTTSHYIKYAKWTGSGWNITELNGGNSFNLSVTIDANNYPHLVYMLDALRYAKKIGSSWSYQNIDTMGDDPNKVLRVNVSIALDTNNNPRVSYYDGANGNLKYVKWVPYYIKGYVKNSGGTAISEVTMTLSGSASATIITGTTGFYQFSNLSEETYTVTPTKVGYIFTPTSKSYSSISANQDNQNFIGEKITVTQSGDVKVIGGTESKGKVNPDKGESVKVDFKGTGVGKFDCKIFTLTGQIVRSETKENISEGRFEWIPKDIASGIYVVYVKGPGVNVRKKVAIIR